MASPVELFMLLVLLIDLALIMGRLLSRSVFLVAVQGILLGLFSAALQWHHLSVRILIIGAVSIVLKGFIYPWLLKRAIKETDIVREDKPFIGPFASALSGIAIVGIALWLGTRLNLHSDAVSSLVVPVSLATLLCGLFLVVARRTTFSQCLGYLVIENGIYVFGIAAAGEIPALVELGMLLDAFFAVSVMGIAIFQINRTFDHIDATKLTSLKG